LLVVVPSWLVKTRRESFRSKQTLSGSLIGKELPASLTFPHPLTGGVDYVRKASI